MGQKQKKDASIKVQSDPYCDHVSYLGRYLEAQTHTHQLDRNLATIK